MPIIDGKVIGNPNDTYARPYTTIRGVGIPGPEGTPGLIWQGEYSTFETYQIPDVVYFEGSSYVYINVTPSQGSDPFDGAIWQYLARGIDPTVLAVILAGLDKHYHHIQAVPSPVWVINHGLNKRPSIMLLDSAGTVIEADLQHTSTNSAVATFSSAFAGEAICN